jgi:peptide/nickel transport system permease protein
MARASTLERDIAVWPSAPTPLPPSRSLLLDARRRFRRNRPAMFGLLILAVIGLAVLFGPLVYRTPIDDIDLLARLKGPTLAHPMGTDGLGQDILSRALIGGRVSLAVGATAALIAMTIGTALGAVAGFRGGATDTALMRLTDLFFSLPTLPLFLLIIFVFRDAVQGLVGPQAGVFVLIVAVIGGLRWMPVARLVRACFLSIKEQEYIVACKCIGVPARRQVFRHMLPNALGPVIVATTLAVGAAILAESTLSFLGLGFPPGTPTWGRMLLEAKDRLDAAPHLALGPGLLIALTVLSINFVGDGLEDALDPRRRR